MSQNEADSKKWDRAILALLEYPTITEAAKRAGVGRATLQRWLADESFQGRLRAARTAIFDQTLTAIQSASAEAISTLRAALSHPMAKWPTRVKAASKILDLSLRGGEMRELVARIEALESALKTILEGR